VKPKLKRRLIILLALLLGGFIALNLVAYRQAWAMFQKMLNTVRHRFEAMGIPSFPGAQLLVFWGGVQAGFDGFAHNPVQYAAAVRCPILFLHGAADPRARLEEARRVFAAVSAPKRFKEFPALGHESAVTRFPAEWKETVSQFLKDGSNRTLP
jgi:hypothetical protein